MNFLIEKQLKVLKAQEYDKKIKRQYSLRENLRPVYRKMRKGLYGLRDSEVKLPDFLIIGCQKCGTSSLHHYLANHPSVWSPEKKELHFFDYHYDLGLPFYKQYFNNQPDNIDDLLVGEATPEYIFHPYSAERIKKTLPKVKAIVLLRSPIERAFSAWRMGIRQGWETLSFEDAIEAEGSRIIGDMSKLNSDEHYYGFGWNHHSYLLRGHYSDQVENWLLHFKREDLLVLSAEKFFTDTKEEFKRVCDFLEIDEWYPEKFQNMFVGVNDSILETTRRKLEDYFLMHNKKLYSILGEDFGW